MAETLLIRFTGDVAPAITDTESPESSTHQPTHQPMVQWLLTDQQGGRLATVMQGPLSEAAALATHRQVMVIVPGSEVLLAELELPAKNAARLQQMVPFALEEQLAGDIEDLHFVIGKRNANNKTPVAAIADASMRSWIAQLTAAGIVADAIYPESLLLPATAHGTTLLVDGDAIHVRGASICSSTIEATPFIEALRLALPSDPNGPIASPVTIYISQVEYEMVEGALDALREQYSDLQIKLLTDGSLPLLALQACGNEAFSLQQGKYQPVRSLASSTARWRIAAALALVAVLLHVTYHGTQLWRLTRQEKQLDEQIGSVLTQALPGSSKDIAMARNLFESRLAQLQKGGGSSDLLLGLSTLSQAMAQAPGTQIDNLAYSNKTMNLRLNAPSVDVLDQLRVRVQAGGLQAELQGATPHEKNVEGRLQLKAPGA